MDERNQIKNEYVRLLNPLGFIPQRIGENVRHNVQSLVFRVPDSCERNRLIELLKRKNVETTIGTYSLSATTYYEERYKDVQPNSAHLNNCVITVPCYLGVDVKHVTAVIKSAMQ